MARRAARAQGKCVGQAGALKQCGGRVVTVRRADAFEGCMGGLRGDMGWSSRS
jgi:hypothetical protein